MFLTSRKLLDRASPRLLASRAVSFMTRVKLFLRRVRFYQAIVQCVREVYPQIRE